MKKVVFLIATLFFIVFIVSLGIGQSQMLQKNKLEKYVLKKPKPSKIMKLIDIIANEKFYYEEIYYYGLLAKVDAKNKAKYEARIETIRKDILKDAITREYNRLSNKLRHLEEEISDMRAEIKQFKKNADYYDQRSNEVKDPKIKRDFQFKSHDANFEAKRMSKRIKDKEREVEAVRGLFTAVNKIKEEL